MLRFKQFINSYLLEATISHFSHLGLDANNPEHKDMVDAYNSGLNSPENKITAKPNQIKTFDQLKSTVAPHIAKIEKKRKEDAEDREAFANKDAELVHHDTSTGLKVFKVRSGKGCAAVGGDTKWCVAHRETGNAAMRAYDPEGEHSYVIHTPEKGNLSKIGIIGVKPGQKHSDGVGGNFQDKGNNTVSDERWDMLRKKYNLDNVKSLHGIRGLKNPEIEKENKAKADDLLNKIKTAKTYDEKDAVSRHLAHAAENGYLNAEHVHHFGNEEGDDGLQMLAYYSNDPEVHRALVKHKNAGQYTLPAVFDKQKYDPEVHKAIANHENAGDDILYSVADKSDDPEVHKAIANHENAGDNALAEVAEKSYDPEVHKAIVKHKNAGHYALREVASKSNDPEVHKAIVKHKNADDDVFASVAYNSNDPEVHKAIANHENADDDILYSVAKKSYDPEVHRAILKHKNAGPHALYSVADKSDDPEVHKAILKHKNATHNTLYSVAKKSDDPEVHRAILSHEKADGFVLDKVAEKYNLEHDGSEESKARISKAIDDHIRNKQGNPYQLESFLSAYRRVIK